ncbi:putative bifunctional diguanylate cyclase/phosphodiesterase [Psychromonas aquimarina]|uniref:putative bifunctional diguanylate cyclase/phosphodiesterase n=1 Tax=Psychromonas aquimarina TaxID=444919 RepID=UPI000403C26E|nr:diguanylate cyclase [Psychromonas aquimarina]
MNNFHSVSQSDKKIPFTQKIGYKLTASFLIAMLFVLSIGLFFNLKMVQKNYSLLTYSQFQGILDAHEFAIERFLVGPETWSEHLANEHELRKIFSETQLSLENIKTLLNKHEIVFFADMFVNFIDKNGRVIYCSDNCDYLGHSLLGVDLIRRVTDSSATESAIVSYNDRFAFYSVSPVFTDNSRSRNTGYVIVGKTIDDNYMADIQINNDVQIAIVRDRAVMASTIKIDNNPLIDIPLPYIEYLRLLKQHGQIIEIEFLKQKYFVTARNIKRMSSDISGSILLLKPRRELEEIESTLFTKYIYLCLFSFVIIIITGTAITRRLLSPVLSLTNASIETAGGKHGIRAEIMSNDEFGLLAANFNAMLITIEEQHHYIQNQNESLEERVERRTRDLNRAMNDLKKLTVAVEKSPVGIIITNARRVIEYVNPMFTQLSGYSKEQAVGRTPRLLKSEHTSEEELQQLWKQVSSGSCWRGDLYNKTKSGRLCWHRVLITPVKNETGRVTHYLGSLEDITSIKEQEDKLIQQATFDTLTGLPNRFLAQNRLNQTLSAIQRNNNKGALLFIDLDNFKEVNDTLGHHAGDELLKSVAKHMTKVVRNEDTVARLGGDEFLIIIGEIKNRSDVEYVAEKIITLIAREFVIDNTPVFVSASIGISIFPGDGTRSESLMKKADSAMYMAKKQGKNCFCFFSPPSEQ